MCNNNQRGFPLLLPFLAGAVVGPLFFNGFNNGGNNQQCCGYYYPYQPMPPSYQNQYFYPYILQK